MEVHMIGKLWYILVNLYPNVSIEYQMNILQYLSALGAQFLILKL